VTVALVTAVVAAFVPVVFGAAAVVLAVVAAFATVAFVVAAAGTVVAGAAVVAGATVVTGSLTDAVATGSVEGGRVASAFKVVPALVVLAEVLELTSGTGGVGVDESGFAIAPTAPRLMMPPAMTPILTLPLSAFHCPASPFVFPVLGIP